MSDEIRHNIDESQEQTTEAALAPNHQLEENPLADDNGATPESSEGDGAAATEGANPEVELAEVTLDQLRELKAKADKSDEHWDRVVRLTAEFDNFRKRAARERQDSIRYANTSILEKLLPVLDNFEAALAAADAAPGQNADALKTGVQMIYSQLKSVATESGLEEIDARSQPFDPNWHEAVAQQESAEVAEGHVVQQLRKGYKLRDRLLRPASVIVAKPPAA